MQHTFFVHFFAFVLHDYNVKLPETFLWRQCRKCSCSLFFHCCPFSPCIDGRQHCHRGYKILMLMLFLQQKNVSFVFYLSLQISVALFLVKFRWPIAFSLSFSCSIVQIFLDMAINPSLILLGNADTAETISAFFRFSVSSLLTLQLTLLYKTRVAMRFPAKITSSCI